MKKLTLAPLVLALCQVACGGANGEPLVAGNLTGSYDGRSFTAINGFAAIEDDEEIRYSVSAPVDVRTRDVSDTLRLVAGGDVVVKWEEKKRE